jgi:hypothetical protein
MNGNESLLNDKKNGSAGSNIPTNTASRNDLLPPNNGHENEVLPTTVDTGPASEMVGMIQAIHSQILASRHESRMSAIQTQQQLASFMTEIKTCIVESIEKQTRLINQNIRRIGIQPTCHIDAAPRQNENDVVVHRTRPAILSHKPPNLYVLWQEYVQEIGDNKAAKDFTGIERGRNKHKYHRRKVFWDQVLKMVNLQIAATAELAIDAIYGKYGKHQTVTKILNKMREDRGTQEGIRI